MCVASELLLCKFNPQMHLNA